MEITIGADPEVFVKKGKEYVSAHGLVPGTKTSPFKVDKGAVQVDGMALEFNIDPAKSEEEFLTNINTVVNMLASMVPEHDLSFVPSVNFGRDYINSQPAEARELGCDPDYNAYTGRANDRPDSNSILRTAAGHVHIGWTEGASPFSDGHFTDCIDLAKALDITLGIPSLLLDTDKRRRSLYGMAGAFRPKPYGMEYRVLSNFWVTKPEYIKWVYSTVYKTVNILAEKGLYEGIYNPFRCEAYKIKWMISNGMDDHHFPRMIKKIRYLGIEVPFSEE